MLRLPARSLQCWYRPFVLCGAKATGHPWTTFHACPTRGQLSKQAVVCQDSEVTWTDAPGAARAARELCTL
eukprot:9874133-Alexandrium_andersonii.AAC.1